MDIFRKIKQALTGSTPPKSERDLPPIIQTPAPPPIPPVISQPQAARSQLYHDQVTAMLERVIQQKFGQDRSLLSPELFEALLLCVVRKKIFKFISGHSGPPSEQVVVAFEQTIGFGLPQDYRDFAMSSFGCLFVEANENIWPRPKDGAIVPAWHLQHTLYVYGLSADVPDFMDIRQQFAGYSKRGRRIVPFLRLEGSFDQYCFSPDGRIVLWRSDTQDMQHIDFTFTALLLRELTTLQERAQRIQNEPNPYA